MSGDILDSDTSLLTLQRKPLLQSTDTQRRIQTTMSHSAQDKPKVSTSHGHNTHLQPYLDKKEQSYYPSLLEKLSVCQEQQLGNNYFTKWFMRRFKCVLAKLSSVWVTEQAKLT